MLICIYTSILYYIKKGGFYLISSTLFFFGFAHFILSFDIWIHLNTFLCSSIDFYNWLPLFFLQPHPRDPFLLFLREITFLLPFIFSIHYLAFWFALFETSYFHECVFFRISFSLKPFMICIWLRLVGWSSNFVYDLKEWSFLTSHFSNNQLDSQQAPALGMDEYVTGIIIFWWFPRHCWSKKGIIFLCN